MAHDIGAAEAAAPPPLKNPRLGEAEEPASMFTIGKDVTARIFGFLGARRFLFMGLTCKSARSIYVETFSAPDVSKATSLRLRDLCGFPVERRLAQQKALVKWAWESGLPKNGGLLVQAAADGDISLAEFLRSGKTRRTREPWTMQASEAAASAGHLAFLQWARDENGGGMEKWGRRVILNAAAQGHLALIEWAHSQGCMAAGTDPVAAAIKGGHADVVDWFLAHDAKPTATFALLQWAVTTGCPTIAHTCAAAADCGQLGMLQWLRAQGCAWDAITCSAAAKGGHLSVLQWARSRGCPWTEYTCFQAARHGQLEVLRWVRANGAPWRRSECRRAAAEAKAHAIVEFIDSVPAGEGEGEESAP
ncbi:hypothetical protein JKP88DRAFT_350688 [Tribonema minus]|uniref:Ankyrin repeat domain-containing protein n=1 Tax=Tribonema minus TaxID=303371 RepID=A0A835YN49_9STRA|nr:hypothetical protein JKP88DRAFT_350688 [Tribonema minus]